MAKISNAKPKSNSGGYERIFGNKALGMLMTRVHSAVIASGSELERMIGQLVKHDGRIIEDCKEFFDRDITPDQVSIIPKQVLKKWEDVDFSKSEPDFVIVKNAGKKRHCYIIELKDGDMFDTKKAQGEKETLKSFENYISRHIPYTTSIHVCCFNQEDKSQIIAGFKGRITADEAMTGTEFCNLLGIDHNEITQSRKRDAKDNFGYFIDQLLKIDTVRDEILKRLK